MIRSQSPAIPKKQEQLAIRLGHVAPKAKEVIVTGDFTRWSRTGVPLRTTGDGIWETTLLLAPGEYQYRLLVDGLWQDHPNARKRVPNPFGSENCVLVVKEPIGNP
jgi:1,4-alpha-glucan branching enzyme